MPLSLASDAIIFTDSTRLSSGIITSAQLSAGAVQQSFANVSGPFSFRNKLINGNFDIWQRDITHTAPISSAPGYCTADRFAFGSSVGQPVTPARGTRTVSRQTTTSTEFSAFQANYYARVTNNIITFGGIPLNENTNGGSQSLLIQNIENAYNFLGKTFTLSFWARASQATKIFHETQIFTSVAPGMWTPTIVKVFDLTTSWQKFTHTYTVPTFSQVVSAAYDPAAVDGNLPNPPYTPIGASNLPPLSAWITQVDFKTYWTLREWRVHGNAYAGQRPSGFEGTNMSLADFQAVNNSVITSGWYDIAQIQLEEGSVATPFEVRPLGLELALCQRYYELGYAFLDNNTSPAVTDTQYRFVYNYKQTKRTPTPTVTRTGGPPASTTPGAFAPPSLTNEHRCVVSYNVPGVNAEYDLTFTIDGEL